MNASLTSLPSRRASASRTVPVGRRSAQARAPFPNFAYSSVSHPAEDLFRQIWTPGLLDQLQAPLTRYHE